ncbi:MAG: hypothetical protein O2968_06435 [Acidobacteria bacterium]|nr:hypothetical protein [Acidobacteriota bacterium]
MSRRSKNKTAKSRESSLAGRFPAPSFGSQAVGGGASRSLGEQPPSLPEAIRTIDLIIWSVVLLTIYATVGTWGNFDFRNLMGYYDLFADTLLAGQLHINIRPEQGYIHDMIPFEGRYYLQWGPLPGIFHAGAKLVGLALTDRLACILAGWLTSLVFLGIMIRLRADFFPEISKAACRWFFFAFALATPTAIIALRGTVYHESIGIGVLFIVASLYAFLRSLEGNMVRWAAAAGAFIGLAMLSRVTLVVYAPALFLFLGIALYARASSFLKLGGTLAAFSLPVFAAGGIQMIYNAARFGSPWDYGNNYLADATGKAPFGLSRIPENLKHYLLALPDVVSDFPWIEHVGWTPLVETLRAEDASSLLLASPFVLLALITGKLARPASGPLDLRIFVGAAALGSAIAFVMLLTFASAARRYTQDFFPVWVVLAFIGFGLWRPPRLPSAVVKPASWAVLAASVLLHFHLSFTQPFNWDPPDINIMRTFVTWSPVARAFLPAGPRFNREEAIIRNDMGTLALKTGRYAEAVQQLELAARYMPGEARIQQNFELAKRALARSRAGGSGNR